MSGGYFDYVDSRVGYEIDGKWQDEDINELFHDLFCADLWGSRNGGLAAAYGGLAAALDFWLSGDICEETYREYVAAFKKKWFNRTPEDRVEFYRNKLQEHCDKLKEEMGV